MYSECISLSESIQKQRSQSNVLSSLSKFSSETGHEVVLSVLRPLEELVSGRSSPFFLSTPEQVDWTMQVIGFGLTLPLSDKQSLQGCVNVYNDWLSALLCRKRSLPNPVADNPNHYACIIFNHFCSLFVPRDDPRLLEDHVELCSSVLNNVHAKIGVKGLNMSRDSWEALFGFLLHVCNLLLAPPASTPSLGTSLCDKLVHVLFSSWLRACQDCFPSPSMWKTLREFCCNWRHHYSVIDQWNKLMYSVTFRVIHYLYGPKHLSQMEPLPQQDEDFAILLNVMPDDSIVQCWFRMLHTAGNPVDLLYPDIITSGLGFRDSLSETDLITSTILVLPNIFHTVMKGISAQVCLFLGHRLPESELHIPPVRTGSTSSSNTLSSPSTRRKESSSRSQFYTPTPMHHVVSKKESFYINITPDKKTPFFPGTLERYSSQEGIIGKPTGNTLLHIYGNWLFEAAVWEGQDQEGFPLRRKSHSSTTVISSAADISRLRDSLPIVISPQQRLRDYESGRAEAFSALCMIFSNMPCGENVMKVYLARFYHSLSIGLKYDPQVCSGQVLTRIILMSSTLLRKDFPGANVLVLPFLTALEKILGVKNLPYKGEAAAEKLRRASISMLLSIIPLPLHFVHLNIPDITPTVQAGLSPRTKSKTFYSLKNRVLKLLFTSLEMEQNAINTQMLLHAVMVYFQDIIIYEQSIATMMGEGAAGGGDTQFSNTYREDISLSMIFHQAIVSAHTALKNHSRDNTVTLASLELLAGIARLQFDSHTHVDCRDAVQWVCEFIETQAQEKPYLQTKDLHTSIVAAFKTLMVWIMEHPHLLAHESCLIWILRVTEFGITGKFSQDEDGVIFKGDKEARPVSGRVKEIAEFMLYCVMEKFGSFPTPCGAAASGSLLTEEEIIKRLKRTSQGKFKYYLIDNSMILGLLEGSFTDVEGSLPTVTSVIRGPAGRQVWSLQMRQHPRSENLSTAHLKSQPRPIPTDVPPPCPNLKRPPWPPEVTSETMKLDEAIPDIDSVLQDSSSVTLHQKICQLLASSEKVLSDEEKVGFSNCPPLEPPQIKETFDTVRLCLNHLGLLSINNMKVGASSPSIMALDSSSMNFRSSLAALDRMPTRYCDSVYVVYCRKGQNRVEDILSHQNLSSKPQEYVEFLQGLGWVVDPVKHPGFSGRLRPEMEEGSRHIGLSAQIPYRPFPYFADAINEVAFIQPSLKQSTSNSTSSIRSVESSDSGPDLGSGATDVQPSSTSTTHMTPSWTAPSGCGVQESSVQADIERTTRGGSNKGGGSVITNSGPLEADTPRRRTAIPQDCAAIVVWLECYEDHFQFPLETVSRLLHKGCCKTSKDVIPTIFVHKLNSGLYQIATRSSSSTTCGPLISGMVISRRCLSTLVRATVANLCFSHRLENEGYSPPHVKRKRKIEDIGSQFSKNMAVSELYTELISNSN